MPTVLGFVCLWRLWPEPRDRTSPIPTSQSLLQGQQDKAIPILALFYGNAPEWRRPRLLHSVSVSHVITSHFRDEFSWISAEHVSKTTLPKLSNSLKYMVPISKFSVSSSSVKKGSCPYTRNIFPILSVEKPFMTFSAQKWFLKKSLWNLIWSLGGTWKVVVHTQDYWKYNN